MPTVTIVNAPRVKAHKMSASYDFQMNRRKQETKMDGYKAITHNQRVLRNILRSILLL